MIDEIVCENKGIYYFNEMYEKIEKYFKYEEEKIKIERKR